MKVNNMDVCIECGEAVKGTFTVAESSFAGFPVIRVSRTVDNDHIVCDCCNDTYHMACCSNWHSGLCDRCLRRDVELDRLQETPA